MPPAAQRAHTHGPSIDPYPAAAPPLPRGPIDPTAAIPYYAPCGRRPERSAVRQPSCLCLCVMLVDGCIDDDGGESRARVCVDDSDRSIDQTRRCRLRAQPPMHPSQKPLDQSTGPIPPKWPGCIEAKGMGGGRKGGGNRGKGGQQALASSSPPHGRRGSRSSVAERGLADHPFPALPRHPNLIRSTNEGSSSGLPPRAPWATAAGAPREADDERKRSEQGSLAVHWTTRGPGPSSTQKSHSMIIPGRQRPGASSASDAEEGPEHLWRATRTQAHSVGSPVVVWGPFFQCGSFDSRPNAGADGSE